MTNGKTNNLREGFSLGHYRILKKIGSGGMGEVYLAEDSRLSRKVALKILPENIASDNERLRRFKQEAFAASALNHPNILTIFEFDAENQTHFIATEYVEGETLREKLKNNEISLKSALNIAEQIAFALSAAHSAGIVHRDLKPENVMIRRDRIVKLLDFGLAKLIEKKEASPDAEAETRALVKTDPGVVMGTFAYMSPEQARGKDIDTRTDIWSLGVVLYEMLSGRLPFEAETPNEYIASILKSDPLPLENKEQEIPVELAQIVRKTLRKDKDARYQTMKGFLADLKELKEEIALAEKLERSVSPNRIHQTENQATQIVEAETTNDATRAQTASSAEYIASEIKQHKRGFLAVLLVLLIAALGLGYWFYASRSVSNDSGQINSIAVLPFENGSSDPNLDYLSDGLSESLIDKLSQLPQLKVIARNSSFKYRGANVDVQDAANKLGVRAIVMGKIMRVGDNLTVRVEMTDAAENRQLWSEQYNRKAADLLSIQQEIAQTASDKLRLKLSGAQEQQLTKRETVNPQAYELVLKGNFYDNLSGTENDKKANELYQQAVAADPNYALAYAELSNSYSMLAANSLVDPKESLPKAESAARRALELDEKLPKAHLAMATIYRYGWNWAAAEREYKRAIELNPNLGDARRGYSAYLSSIGQHDEAIAEAKRAKELDPLTPSTRRSVGYRLYFARRYDEAIEDLRKMLETEPNSAGAILGYAYAANGQFKEAIAAYQEAIRSGNKSTSVQIYLGEAYALNGEREKAQAILKELQTTKEYVSPGELATLYTALGDKEAAFASLEKAYAERDVQMEFLKIDPSLDPLRSDPRYQDLLRRVGLPQ